jgi:hypothetical protein
MEPIIFEFSQAGLGRSFAIGPPPESAATTQPEGAFESWQRVVFQLYLHGQAYSTAENNVDLSEAVGRHVPARQKAAPAKVQLP